MRDKKQKINTSTTPPEKGIFPIIKKEELPQSEITKGFGYFKFTKENILEELRKIIGEVKTSPPNLQTSSDYQTDIRALLFQIKLNLSSATWLIKAINRRREDVLSSITKQLGKE